MRCGYGIVACLSRGDLDGFSRPRMMWLGSSLATQASMPVKARYTTGWTTRRFGIGCISASSLSVGDRPVLITGLVPKLVELVGLMEFDVFTINDVNTSCHRPLLP